MTALYIAAGVAAYLLLAVPVAVLIGRAIRQGDRRATEIETLGRRFDCVADLAGRTAANNAALGYRLSQLESKHYRTRTISTN